ncbi:hypothetical protein FTUN_1838 [Frigoriglobus tundricola]|uniref:Uncharacterized protein n=1 Tax=Frigoriglobus tundricola TaxID=2774151 RepID=A0A6M5YK00_9BACT|nr:hypothetical protein FTUN_1838 [Frigoriglobus tundricola]
MVREFGLAGGAPIAPSLPVSPQSLSICFASVTWAAVPLMYRPGFGPFTASMCGPPASCFGKLLPSRVAASSGSSTFSGMTAFSRPDPPGWSMLRSFATSSWSSGEARTMIWSCAVSGIARSHGILASTILARSAAAPLGTGKVLSTGSAGTNLG